MRILDRISIKGTEYRERPEGHYVYCIEVQTKSNAWTVKRRFNEFVELHNELSKTCQIPESLPPKKLFGSNTQAVADQRAPVLEKYLKAILLSPDQKLAQHMLFYQFLEFEPPSKETFFDNVDENNWLEQYKVLENLADSISAHISNHEKALKAGAGNPDELLQAKKKIVALSTKIGELAQWLEPGDALDPTITEKEILRRRDMLSKLKIAKDALEQRIKNPRTNNENRNELFRGNDESQRGPRSFGKPVETEQTKNLDDHGLIQLQQDHMKEQDQQLDELLTVLKKQAQIGQMIGDELDLQNKMLDELDADVDRTRSKLKKAGKTLVKISANA